MSFYRDVDGNRCRQELDFYLDRTGVDFIRVEYPNGHVETFEYYFRWNWENYAQTSIRMDYGRNDVSYLDDVYKVPANEKKMMITQKMTGREISDNDR